MFGSGFREDLLRCFPILALSPTCLLNVLLMLALLHNMPMSDLTTPAPWSIEIINHPFALVRSTCLEILVYAYRTHPTFRVGRFESCQCMARSLRL